MDQGQRSDITDCVTVDLLESTPDSNHRAPESGYSAT